MNTRQAFRMNAAAVTVAFALCGGALAQSSSDARTSTFASDVTTQGQRGSAGTASHDASTINGTSTAALPTVPATIAATARASQAGESASTMQMPNDANTAIGSTSVVRSDSANEAFEKLAHGNAFLSPADVNGMPGFGGAFAQADRDRDGRLDRTEFTHAWSSYDEAASTASSTPTDAAAVNPSSATMTPGAAPTR